MNKKAVSEVITTVLLVLLVLAAIGIFWFFIQPLIERTEETGSSTNCLTLDLEIVSAKYNSVTGITSIDVKRNAGEGNLNNLTFVIDGSVANLPSGSIPKIGETKGKSGVVSGYPLSTGTTGKQVTVAGVFGTITCPASEPKTIVAG